MRRKYSEESLEKAQKKLRDQSMVTYPIVQAAGGATLATLGTFAASAINKKAGTNNISLGWGKTIETTGLHFPPSTFAKSAAVGGALGLLYGGITNESEAKTLSVELAKANERFRALYKRDPSPDELVHFWKMRKNGGVGKKFLNTVNAMGNVAQAIVKMSESSNLSESTIREDILRGNYIEDEMTTKPGSIIGGLYGASLFSFPKKSSEKIKKSGFKDLKKDVLDSLKKDGSVKDFLKTSQEASKKASSELRSHNIKSGISTTVGAISGAILGKYLNQGVNRAIEVRGNISDFNEMVSNLRKVIGKAPIEHQKRKTFEQLDSYDYDSVKSFAKEQGWLRESTTDLPSFLKRSKTEMNSDFYLSKSFGQSSSEKPVFDVDDNRIGWWEMGRLPESTVEEDIRDGKYLDPARLGAIIGGTLAGGKISGEAGNSLAAMYSNKLSKEDFEKFVSNPNKMLKVVAAKNALKLGGGLLSGLAVSKIYSLRKQIDQQLSDLNKVEKNLEILLGRKPKEDELRYIYDEAEDYSLDTIKEWVDREGWLDSRTKESSSIPSENRSMATMSYYSNNLPQRSKISPWSRPKCLSEYKSEEFGMNQFQPFQGYNR